MVVEMYCGELRYFLIKQYLSLKPKYYGRSCPIIRKLVNVA